MSPKNESKDLPSIEELNAKYAPFAPFSAWAGTRIDASAWQVRKDEVSALADQDAALYARARMVASRAAAIDTGALEGLYELDEGFTISVAMQSGIWQSAYEQQVERTRALIEAQLAGYDHVLDFATKARPIAEAWIRELHDVLCREQGRYLVQTATGPQEQELPTGVYKSHPNHVRQPDGTIHAYAPVFSTAAEMRRLIEEVNANAFMEAHPVVQSAYAHYALTAVHPFADGNGRVARALASVFMYRGGSIPFLVLMEHRSEYLATLREADAGRFKEFVGFSERRAADAFGLVRESLKAAAMPLATDEQSALRRQYRTSGGYAHTDLDPAGVGLLLAAQQRAQQLLAELQSPELTITARRHTESFPEAPKGYRNPIGNRSDLLRIEFVSAPPASGSRVLSLVYHLPHDARGTDEVLLRCLEYEMSAGIAVAQIVPAVTTVARLKVALFLEGLFGRALKDLRQQGAEAMKTAGYRSRAAT